MHQSCEPVRYYIAIDLKSFYASAECMARQLDPLSTNLVVADPARTEKTICLAVSPSLKAYGIPGRARLFEVIQKVRDANGQRLFRLAQKPSGNGDPVDFSPSKTPGFTGRSVDACALAKDPSLEIDYIVAPPRMNHYIEISSHIYQIYLKYIAPEDIHVYSIDEVMMDVTSYLNIYHCSARELAKRLIQEVLKETGITAAAGIGTNLYLCKIAMDIVAKHMPADQDGVRIAFLDEMSYRRLLWNHQPITDFWRVGRGYAKKLAEHGMYTMGDIARCSLGKADDYYREDLLYRLFGINAELLIDHAWGYEPVTIRDIKAYRPANNSLNAGQVLTRPYDFQQARLVTKEMTEALVLELVEKGLLTNQVILTICYDRINIDDPSIRKNYRGEVTTDRYGRKTPRQAHGSRNLKQFTSSTRLVTEAMLQLYEEIVDPDLLVRKIYVTANHLKSGFVEDHLSSPLAAAFVEDPPGTPEQTDLFTDFEQMNLFTDYEALEKERIRENENLEREHRLQLAMLSIQKKYGKNAILRGTDYEDGATARQRNEQIGGHKA